MNFKDLPRAWGVTVAGVAPGPAEYLTVQPDRRNAVDTRIFENEKFNLGQLKVSVVLYRSVWAIKSDHSNGTSAVIATFKTKKEALSTLSSYAPKPVKTLFGEFQYEEGI